jgi:hypothetical protein
MSSCIIDPADLDIIRGNNYPPGKWQFLSSENPDVLFPLDGSVFKLTVAWPGLATPIVKSSDVDAELVIDLPTSILTWNYSVALSRSLPLGRIPRYEIERWIDGTQQSLVAGYLAVSIGSNPDA